MKRIKNHICLTGVWVIPVSLIILLSFLHTFYPETPIDYMLLNKWLLFCAIFMAYTMLVNSVTLKNGKINYGPFDAFFLKTDRYAHLDRPKEATYPEVPKELLFKKPIGILLGKYKGQYVCNDLAAGGSHNTFIIGETGCGKSVLALSTLLNNIKGKSFTVFAIDIKGELHEKGSKANDRRNIIIDPSDKLSYGYDPFYMLKDSYSKQDLVDAANNITYSLIPINPKASNPFWENSARDLLLACILYFYKNDFKSLIGIVDEITSKPINDIIDDIASGSDDDSPEHKIISRYIGMADETLSGINGQMSSSLSLFITDNNVRYMLRDNPVKANPTMLNNRFHIFLSIQEHKLSEYSRLLHLIINQVVNEMEQRPEDSIPTLILIDELARILSSGRILKLENSLETLRSRKVTVMLISQSLDAIQRAYQKPEVEGMLQNCPYKIILSSSSKDTTDSVIRWSGKYKCDKYSHGKSGHGYSRNISYEDSPRVESSDLITLPSKGEAIIITPFGYNRIKKVQYYKDKILSKISQEVNDSWKNKN